MVAFLLLTLRLGDLTVFTIHLPRRVGDHQHRSSGIYEIADYHPVLSTEPTTPENDSMHLSFPIRPSGRWLLLGGGEGSVTWSPVTHTC